LVFILFSFISTLYIMHYALYIFQSPPFFISFHFALVIIISSYSF